MLAVGLTAGPLTSHSASAQLAACRSDPVVVLSNLATIDLQASINDSVSDVKSVVYVVHAPKGTSLVSVVNTDTLVGLKETVKFYADNTAGSYDVYTTVSTGQTGVGVTAYLTVVSAVGLSVGAPAVLGWSGQTLHSHVGSLL